jgi:hypothetical protein
MSFVRAVYQGGRVIVEDPVEWPEGCRLRIEPERLGEIHFMTEEEQSDDPEAIARWIAEFDSIPPLKWSEEEITAWETWQQKMKAYNLEASRKEIETELS